MAFQLEVVDTAAKVITAINALTPSTHAGQDVQLIRAQAAAVAEVNAFPATGKFLVKMEGHHDAATSKIVIVVQPVRSFAGQIAL